MTTRVGLRHTNGILVDFSRITPDAPPSASKIPDAVPKPRTAYGEEGFPKPRPGMQLASTGADGVPMRVPVEYNYSEPFGMAEVVCCFEMGHTVLLAAGGVCRVEQLKPGMQFQLKGGGFATVSKVKAPIPWPKQNPVPDQNGNVMRRILGRSSTSGTPSWTWYSPGKW